MRDLYWLSADRLRLIEPCFPQSRAVARVDDLRVTGGIIFVLKRGRDQSYSQVYRVNSGVNSLTVMLQHIILHFAYRIR